MIRVIRGLFRFQTESLSKGETMKPVNFSAHLLALFALAIFIGGCSNSGSNDQKPAAASGSQTTIASGHDRDEGDHDRDGHDHDKGDQDHDGHDHAEGDQDSRDSSAEHEGPHGGHVIELGHNHQYHAELVENEDTSTVTVFMLDQDMKELAIDQASVTMNLMVDGQVQSFELAAAGAAAGGASRFDAAGNALFEALHEHEASGKLRVTIDGSPYSGEVEHHPHGEHDEHED